MHVWIRATTHPRLNDAKLLLGLMQFFCSRTASGFEPGTGERVTNQLLGPTERSISLGGASSGKVNPCKSRCLPTTWKTPRSTGSA